MQLKTLFLSSKTAKSMMVIPALPKTVGLRPRFFASDRPKGRPFDERKVLHISVTSCPF